MVSQRRIKAFGLIVILIVLTTLYITSALRQAQTNQFYQKTTAALQEKEAKAKAAAEDAISEVEVGKRLREAEAAAKQAADRKDSQFRQEVAAYGKESPGKEREGSGAKGVAGRVVLKGEDDGVAKVGNTGEQVLKASSAPKKDDGEAGPETEEDHEVEHELNAILKKSPIIIFSKSYCPFSKKAKRILLDQYKIVPAPYVVELDEHEMGSKLQDALAKTTGRRTVPNILINGKSIGGGDDIEKLHNDGKLITTVKSMGGKRVVTAELIEAAKL